MSGVVIQFRERARGNISTPMVLWSLAMTVILFVDVVAPSGTVTLWGFGVSALLGIYLGWRRRVGVAMVAPLVSWLFAWFPLVIACMIHFGILKGFFVGLLTITFGWIAIGFVEFAWVGMVALLVRAIRGSSGEDSVIIMGPDER
jgi:hypothetical protein